MRFQNYRELATRKIALAYFRSSKGSEKFFLSEEAMTT